MRAVINTVLHMPAAGGTSIAPAATLAAETASNRFPSSAGWLPPSHSYSASGKAILVGVQVQSPATDGTHRSPDPNPRQRQVAVRVRVGSALCVCRLASDYRGRTADPDSGMGLAADQSSRRWFSRTTAANRAGAQPCPASAAPTFRIERSLARHLRALVLRRPADGDTRRSGLRRSVPEPQAQ
jgi:hypothetical protein